MLSPTSRPYIEASIPVLQEHGLAITQHFYKSMFAAQPELQNLFNMGNQANGLQQQSLAAAVFAYAANIDNAAALGPVIERITHKHASVGIKPAHYPIVGRHLLEAISAVLGSAATPALLQAWDEAYWLLAGELIAAEARLYQSRQQAPGEMRKLQVCRIENETLAIKSIYLTTSAHGSPGEFKPGQYISVAATFDQHPQRQLRQYSLSDSTEKPWWRITIKREAGGQYAAGQVSNWLHTHVKVGDELETSAPFGDFTPLLHAHQPIALISAGVGITPMMSALNTAADRQMTQPILFAFAAQKKEQQAFLTDLNAARDRLPQLETRFFYEDQEGRMDLSQYSSSFAKETHFYLCGPVAFMRAQWHTLLQAGVPMRQIHREVFGPELLDHLLG